MALSNPRGRSNYEPNSWEEDRGPRESPERGFRSFPAEENGEKARRRSETFADHYSQARLFYISQTEVEQKHIAEALTFELSKVREPRIRRRLVAHLLNVDRDLAERVSRGLGIDELPDAADVLVPVRDDLEPSPALSMLGRRHTSFAGRKVGVLLTDGADVALFRALREAADAEHATLVLVAPQVGGVDASDGSRIEADEALDGAPSVLFDAVALLPSRAGAQRLARQPAARDFVSDAAAHCKFIAYTDGARTLFDTFGVGSEDAGFVRLEGAADARRFVTACRRLRFWERAR
jgi:catalase